MSDPIHLHEGGTLHIKFDPPVYLHNARDEELENARLDRGVFQFLLGVSLLANAILGTILVMT